MLNIGWAELLVLIVAGLFVFGPERLPGAVTNLARGIRQVRDYATGAKDQLRAEIGPEFDELRQPLQDLRKLRGMDPKRAMAKHLFSDLDTPEVDTPKPVPPPNLHKPSSLAKPVDAPGSTSAAPFDTDAT